MDLSDDSMSTYLARIRHWYFQNQLDTISNRGRSLQSRFAVFEKPGANDQQTEMKVTSPMKRDQKWFLESLENEFI